MKSANNICGILLLALIIASCEKEILPPGSEGEPVFSLNVNVEGRQVNLVAGYENYYLFTDYRQGPDTIYNFSGTLSKENCTLDCGEKIRFEFRDFKKTPDVVDLRVDNMFRKGTLEFTQKNPPRYNVYQVEFSAKLKDPENYNYSWDFGDDFSVATGILNPFHNFPQPIDFLVPDVTKFIVEDNQGNMCSIEEPIQITRVFEVPCNANFDARLLDNGKMELTSTSVGMGQLALSWNTGDTSKTIQVDANDGIYSLFVKSGANGCISKIERSLTIKNNNIEFISASFDYNLILPVVLNGSLFQMGTVGIQYTDPNGKEYRSDARAQPQGSIFEILDVEDFDQNEKDQSTKKLTIRYECEVFDDAGNKLHLTGNGIIAVAHPL